MKDIGTSIDGNVIVEMEREEYLQFTLLCKAVEGEMLPGYLSVRDHSRINFDFTKTFEVIRSFYEMSFRVADFQSLIDKIRESLNK